MSEDDFRSLVGDDVKQIAVEDRASLASKKRIEDEQSIKLRRLAAESEVQNPDDPLAGEPVEMVAPLDVVAFQRPGVQHGVYRNVRLGKYTFDARLDLHKKTVDQARRDTYQFILDCVANDVRAAIITHGKGEGREQPALLKSYVAHWLPQMEEVLAFHTAHKKHGGYGATYVLIKKSPKKKLETREKLHK